MPEKHVHSIHYNKPAETGGEQEYILQVMNNNRYAGNGYFTRLCIDFFSTKFDFRHCFLTSSCSAALEMAATLCSLKAGDEVIVPSFAYVTTAAAFDAKGARLVFADSECSRPHISPESIRQHITGNTKALVIIHYGGECCNMDEIMNIVYQHDLLLIEDCAHAINATFRGRYAGSFGHFATFSFHETKNIHCGEGGLLVVRDQHMAEKAVRIWQEGTNRHDFEKGLTLQYEWVSPGSSYQPSELQAAFLYAQLQEIDPIHRQRLRLWMTYYHAFASLEKNSGISLPANPSDRHNAHIFYVKCPSGEMRNEMLSYLDARGIMALFHYLPLHISPYWLQYHEREVLPNAETWAKQIVRLPLYHSLQPEEQDYVISTINEFLLQHKPLKRFYSTL